MKPTLKELTCAAALAACMTGCFSWYEEGPPWQAPAPERDGGLVVVYRPQAHWGALYAVTVIQGRRECELVAGSYCTLYFAPGRHTVTVTVRGAVERIMVPIPPLPVAEATTTRVPVEIAPGDVLYLETAFDAIGAPPEARLVAVPSGDLDDTHLAPGGRARRPVPSE